MISANIPNNIRKMVYRRDGYRCALCDSTMGLQMINGFFSLLLIFAFRICFFQDTSQEERPFTPRPRSTFGCYAKAIR